jgi:hypothetical protein
MPDSRRVIRQCLGNQVEGPQGFQVVKSRKSYGGYVAKLLELAILKLAT